MQGVPGKDLVFGKVNEQDGVAHDDTGQRDEPNH